MDSTTGPFKTSPVPSTYDKPNGSYTRLVDAVGCPQGSRSLSCLKQVPIAQLMNVSNTMYDAVLNKLLWAAAPAPGNMVNEISSKRIAQGNFLHIPIIAGSNLNDGSMFSTSLSGLNLTGAAQDQAFQQFVLAGLIDTSRVTPDVLNEITQLYPANDTIGAPYNTGDSLFDRGSAYYGENSYLAPRRRLFQAAAGKQDLWAYYFTEFLPGESKRLGVRHGSELKLLLGPTPSDTEADFTNTFFDFWLNFVTDLKPGPAWPKWTAQSKQVLQLKRDNITVIPDDFGNLNRTNYLNSAKVLEETIR
ncbi:hypothetical protein EVG20_g9245 [Dentipellis fragilis]|uniref:Carboxylesterase type B domain-containing protein n=1 Tax=Dentipellis fragilis TaxID=205917 RepID=A0A4Y9Y242_9AGAM|nr:hypothetical protein EVG20_g9245 [Dentipellis fragilis]